MPTIFYLAKNIMLGVSKSLIQEVIIGTYLKLLLVLELQLVYDFIVLNAGWLCSIRPYCFRAVTPPHTAFTETEKGVVNGDEYSFACRETSTSRLPSHPIVVVWRILWGGAQ